MTPRETYYKWAVIGCVALDIAILAAAVVLTLHTGDARWMWLLALTLLNSASDCAQFAYQWSTPYNADATTFRQERANAALIAAAREWMPRLLEVARAAEIFAGHPLFPRRDDPQMGQADGSIWKGLNALRDALAALESDPEGRQ